MRLDDEAKTEEVAVEEADPQTPQAEEGTPENPSRRVLTVANAITVTRLVLTFVFLFLFANGINRPLAVGIYILAATTDWLDGNIARATKTVSWFGKILDPIVDRALLLMGVLALVIRQELPLWIALVLILRDIILYFGAEYLKMFTSRPVDVIIPGKIATALLMTGYSCLLVGTPDLRPLGVLHWPGVPLLNDTPAGIGIVFVYVGMVFSITAAVMYFKRGFAIRDAILEEQAASASHGS